MLTNTLLYTDIGIIWLTFFIGMGTMIWMTRGGGKWYIGAILGFMVFVIVLIPLRPPVNATPMNDADVTALYEKYLPDRIPSRKHFSCDKSTMIAFLADDTPHYMLLTRGTGAPIYQSEGRAKACYRQNRRIF